MKALFELFRRFDARRIFGFIRRLGGMSRPKVKCYDLRSTRALRVEGDIKGFRKKVIVYQISIHAFRMEGDVLMFCRLVSSILFLSTPSGWRATAKRLYCKACSSDFYPRPPGGGRPMSCLWTVSASYFYPRPPGGGRRDSVLNAQLFFKFLSTPSGWRATRTYNNYKLFKTVISIHALRVEGDARRPAA